MLPLLPLFNQGRIPSARIAAHPEQYVLIHFGLNTFSDREWGYGEEDPAIFNPVHFDADAIAQAVRDAGFQGMILVCKHHDGFCLWPTATTSYNITRSPWRNGNGDMVREFTDAAARAGLQMGFYVSPWDRNHPAYGTPEYVSVFREQLREICSNYGKAFEIWFDGANGGDGYYGGARETRSIDRLTYYGWQDTWQIVRELQPDAAIFSDIGPDLRWVGNESGIADPDSFGSITPRPPADAPADHFPAPGYSDEKLLQRGTPDGAWYLPPECDVPLRPGWFYHAGEDGLQRTTAELLQIYFSSVGSGGFWNLGIAPNCGGVLDPGDLQILREWGKTLRSLFAHCTFQLELSAADDTWHTLDLPENGAFNLLQFSEDLNAGERIRAYEFRFRHNGEITAEISGCAVGRKRLRILQTICADTLEYRVRGTGNDALHLHLAAYLAPEKYFQAEITQKSILDRPDYRKLLPEEIQQHGQTLTVRIPEKTAIAGFVFVPYQNVRKGIPDHYSLYWKDADGAWQLLRSGEFSNIAANPQPQIIPFETLQCREIRFCAEHFTTPGNLLLFRECGILLAPQA